MQIYVCDREKPRFMPSMLYVCMFVVIFNRHCMVRLYQYARYSAYTVLRSKFIFLVVDITHAGDDDLTTGESPVTAFC